jgi:hypothetical protein
MLEEMDGAMQQAAHPNRHSSSITLSVYRALYLEEPLLAPYSAAVASEPSVGADDAVAGHEDRDAVAPVGLGDRAHGGRIPDRAG